jgi:hypothetical protein
MSNANELLERALEAWDFVDEPQFDDINEIMEEIRAYLLAEPAREPMMMEEIWRAYQISADWESFVAGVRLAEKMHGIGGEL